MALSVMSPESLESLYERVGIVDRLGTVEIPLKTSGMLQTELDKYILEKRLGDIDAKRAGSSVVGKLYLTLMRNKGCGDWAGSVQKRMFLRKQCEFEFSLGQMSSQDPDFRTILTHRLNHEVDRQNGERRDCNC